MESIFFKKVYTEKNPLNTETVSGQLKVTQKFHLYGVIWPDNGLGNPELDNKIGTLRYEDGTV